MVMRKIMAAWNGFLFGKADPRQLGTFRAVFGAFLALYLLDLYPTLHLFYAPPAVLPPALTWASGRTWDFSLLAFLPQSQVAFQASFLLSLSGAVALMLGWRTRTAAVICWVTQLSWLNPLHAGKNSGDNVVSVLCFLFVVAAMAGHAQRAFALDSPRERKNMPAWSTRLFQVQLPLIYFFSGFHKLASADWYRGEAVYWVFQQPVWSRFDLTGVTDPLLTAPLTYGSLLFELVVFPVLVWPRATRNWVLALGIVFHVSISATMRVFVFGEVMPIFYLCFFDASPWLERGWTLVRQAGSATGLLPGKKRTAG